MFMIKITEKMGVYLCEAQPLQKSMFASEKILVY